MSMLRILAAALLGLALGAAPAGAQGVQKIKFMEVIHSLFYSPLYIASGKGFFKEEGLDFDFIAAQGSDKATAALLSGAADIVLAGPETAIYIANGQSPTKIKIFAGLTATDGTFIMSKEKMEKFDWSMLKGKTVLGWRKGSSPALYLEEILRKHGLDPEKDVNIVTNTAIPARVGAFMAGTADFGTFFEPDISAIEKAGKGYAIRNVGNDLGQIDYTVFLTRDDYIASNPKVVQGFTNAIAKAEAWVQTADPAEAAKVLAPYFPGVDADVLARAVVRHREANIWKKTPMVTPEAMTALQNLLVASAILKPEQKVAYDRIVAPQFAKAVPGAK